MQNATEVPEIRSSPLIEIEAKNRNFCYSLLVLPPLEQNDEAMAACAFIRTLCDMVWDLSQSSIILACSSNLTHHKFIS